MCCQRSSCRHRKLLELTRRPRRRRRGVSLLVSHIRSPRQSMFGFPHSRSLARLRAEMVQRKGIGVARGGQLRVFVSSSSSSSCVAHTRLFFILSRFITSLRACDRRPSTTSRQPGSRLTDDSEKCRLLRLRLSAFGVDEARASRELTYDASVYSSDKLIRSLRK